MKMGLGIDGLMRREIYGDKYGLHALDLDNSYLGNVRIKHLA